MESERKSRLPIYEVNQRVFLVDGLARSAIYDTTRGKVYSINFQARNIVLDQPSSDVFYQQLEEVELVSRDRSPSEIVFTRPSVGLDFMWLNLTSRCNLTCLHCYQESSPSVLEDTLALRDWESVIEQGFAVGCRRLQFIGGEPLIFKEIFDLAAYAGDMGYELIEIFTNGTLVNPERIETIKRLGINVAISLYSDIPEIHDSVTTKPGSFYQTLNAMKLLKEAGVPTRVGVVVMRQNQNTVDSTIRLVQEFGFGGGDSVDLIRTIGRGKNPANFPDNEYVEKYGLMRKPLFVTSEQDFIRNCFYNPCWVGKIAVESSGNSYPCVAARSHIVGNILEQSIEQVIESTSLQQLWSLGKDDIEICQLCEYRYACGDCRPLAETETGNQCAKTQRCTYNPVKGYWE